MSVTEVLFSPQLIVALIVYAAASLALAIAATRLHGRFEHGANQWFWEHFYLPLLRAAILMGFILLAYPVLFGILNAPPINELLADGKGRFGHLLGIVFGLSLLLPILPVAGSLPALVLPIQGIAAAALVFHWMTDSMGHESISYWPGLNIVALVVAMAWGTYWVTAHALGMAEALAKSFFEVADLDEMLHEGLTLVLQAPVIIVYTLALGGQI